MATFLLILGYIFVIIETLWYFTCTKHKDVPLNLSIVILILSFIPGLNTIMAIANIVILIFMVADDCIELKNNWINRTFLALHE